jgi:hypothetical protein
MHRDGREMYQLLMVHILSCMQSLWLFGIIYSYTIVFVLIMLLKKMHDHLLLFVKAEGLGPIRVLVYVVIFVSTLSQAFDSISGWTGWICLIL